MTGYIGTIATKNVFGLDDSMVCDAITESIGARINNAKLETGTFMSIGDVAGRLTDFDIHDHEPKLDDAYLVQQDLSDEEVVREEESDKLDSWLKKRPAIEFDLTEDVCQEEPLEKLPTIVIHEAPPIKYISPDVPPEPIFADFALPPPKINTFEAFKREQRNVEQASVAIPTTVPKIPFTFTDLNHNLDRISLIEQIDQLEKCLESLDTGDGKSNYEDYAEQVGIKFSNAGASIDELKYKFKALSYRKDRHTFNIAASNIVDIVMSVIEYVFEMRKKSGVNLASGLKVFFKPYSKRVVYELSECLRHWLSSVARGRGLYMFLLETAPAGMLFMLMKENEHRRVQATPAVSQVKGLTAKKE